MGNNHKVDVKVTELGTRLEDFDEKKLNLRHCDYKVGEMTSRRLVKRGLNDEALRQCYSFVSSFRHPAAVTVENYNGKGSIVMSLVNGSFLKWLKRKDPTELFTNGTMRPVIRNMMIGLAEVVQAIHDEQMYIPDLSMKDLYIKLLDDGTPIIQVLIVSARKATHAQYNQTWENVKTIFRGCFDERNLQQNEITEMLCSSIGSKVRYLKNFPDQWDSSAKSKFLMEKCAYRHLSASINSSKLKWPTQDEHQDILSILIRLGQEHATYNRGFTSDYVRLCRNKFKHFHKLPRTIQARLGGSPDGFLRKMEEWSPNIWVFLYEATELK